MVYYLLGAMKIELSIPSDPIFTQLLKAGGQKDPADRAYGVKRERSLDLAGGPQTVT